MARNIAIHSGVINIVACDIDGYDEAAVRDLGDVAASTITIVDTYLGATRYDTNGNPVTYAPAVIQASKAKQLAPDLVTMTLTRVQVDPNPQLHGGTSILVGTTVVDQLTTTNVTFARSASGSPVVTQFEDYPTILETGLTSSEAFGSSAAKLVNPLAAASIASDQAFGASNLAFSSYITATPVTTGEAFGASGISLLGFVLPSSIASPEAFGSSAVALVKRLAASSLATSEAFGVAATRVAAAASGIPSSEAFGSSSIRSVYHVPAASLASDQAFGASRVSPETFVSAASLSSDEAFGASNLHGASPPSTAVPLIVEPGEIRPAGELVAGMRVTTTTGVWTQTPSAARFVWSTDGTPIRDTGFRTGVWQDTYTIQDADAGKTLSVDEYASNSVGSSAAARQAVTALIANLPASGYGHEVVFGPMPSTADIYDAVQTTIQTWLGTYLRERERLAGRAYGSLPSPRGWRVYTDTMTVEPGDQLPACVIVAPGIQEPLVMTQNGVMISRLEVGVSIIVSAHGGANQRATIDLAGEYGAAMRAVFMQHGSLGGIADATSVIGERQDTVDSESQRTLAAAEIVLSIRMSGLTRFGGGPSVPLPDPLPPDDGGPIIGTVETTFLDVERV